MAHSAATENTRCSLEQIGMRSQTRRSEFEIRDGVDQKPVRLDMTFPKIPPFAFQLVILILRREALRYSKAFQNAPHLFEVASLSMSPPEVLPDLGSRPCPVKRDALQYLNNFLWA